MGSPFREEGLAHFFRHPVGAWPALGGLEKPADGGRAAL